MLKFTKASGMSPNELLGTKLFRIAGEEYAS